MIGINPLVTRALMEPESTLIAVAARGDVGAVRQLYLAHAIAVRAFARRLLGDDASAEDLVQEVFLAMPEALRRFRGDASIRTFLLGIAVNRARKHVRSAVRRRQMHERLAETAALAPSGAPGPDEDLERRQLADALTRALDELPLDQRIAFVLCEVEERTSSDAAQIVGEKDATVRARVMHAKRKLRDALERGGVR